MNNYVIDFANKLDKRIHKEAYPICQHKKEYSRLAVFRADEAWNPIELVELLPIEYGRCDRERGCGQENIPKGEERKELLKSYWSKNNAPYPSNRHKKYLETYQRSIKKQERNPKSLQEITKTITNRLIIDPKQSLPSFFHYLKELTSKATLNRLKTIIDDYQIGMIPNQFHTTTFPFINIANQVQAIQVKVWSRENKTIKNAWIHIEPYASTVGLDQKFIDTYRNQELQKDCFMGEHLIKKYSSAPLWIFESMKNCIYAMIEYGLPSESKNNPICLATGSQGFFKKENMKWLEYNPNQRKSVTVFPDNDINERGEATAFHQWKKVMDELNELYGDHYRFQIKDLRETFADMKNNDDITDYLTWKWKKEREAVFLQQSKSLSINTIENTEEIQKTISEPSPFHQEKTTINKNSKNPKVQYQLATFTEEELQHERNLGNRLLYQGTIDQAKEYQPMLQQIINEKGLEPSTYFLVTHSVTHKGDWYVGWGRGKVKVRKIEKELPKI